jgi:hypothetical protein
MNSSAFGRPEKTEYASDYGIYTSLVEGDDILSALQHQMSETQRVLAEIPEEKALYRYSDGKWSIKELVGHLIDSERVMAYRALRIARSDRTPLAGFDQDLFVQNAGFDRCRLSDLAAEFALVRDANIFMFKNLAPEAWSRTGIANENQVTVKALAYIIAGHQLHHIKILNEKYLTDRRL